MKVVVWILVFWSLPAMATDDWRTEGQGDQSQFQNQGQGQEQSAEGGNVNGVSANNEGINSDDDHLSLFMAAPTGTSDCLRGVQTLVFGIQLRDSGCRLQALAEKEPPEIAARLKCDDRRFRNAVAFDVPRKDRQMACIDRLLAEAREDAVSELARQRFERECEDCSK